MLDRCASAWLAVILSLIGAWAPSLAPVAAERPNFVLLIADDQGWGDFGFMRHPVIETPRLDRLAAESAVFPNGYVPTSLCRASLATLLTGLYAHQHRICCNDPPEGIDRDRMLPFLAGAPTVPRLLAKAGYKSLQTGKFWEGHFSNGGFTHGMTTNGPKGRHGDEGLEIGRKTLAPIFDFIAACAGSPFLIWYAPMMPHEPHDPPERLLKKYTAEGRDEKLAKYWAMCEWFDETCGQLLDHLDAKGLRETTLVLFVIDNGWIQQTGEVTKKNGLFAPRSKSSPYDGGVRTPVMIRWPGKVRPGRHEDLVSTIDIAPTCLRAAGLEPTPAMPGLSLLDVAAGRGRLDREAVFGEIFVHTAVDLERPALSLTHRWIRAERWKLIVPESSGSRGDPARPELYDLVRDPTEAHDLAPGEPDRVRRLQALLDRWWSGRG